MENSNETMAERITTSRSARGELPPGPPAFTAAYQTYRVIADPYRTYAEYRARYGDVVLVPALNGKVAVVFTSELAKAVFTADADTYGPFAVDALRPLLGSGAIVVSEGAAHKKMRKLLAPPFHRARMRAYGSTMRAIARRHLEALVPGQSLALHAVTRQISFDVILQTIFGVDESRMAALGPTMARTIDALSPTLLFTDKLQTPWFPPFQRFTAAREAARREMFAMMATRREGLAHGEHHQDILSLLLESRYDDGSSLTDQEILEQLYTLLIAGHETTAIAIAWSMYWLLSDRARLAKLREEVAGLGREPTPEAVAKLPYLDAVCTESLRLNPILPDPLRLLRKPLKLGPYTIPAGYGVAVAACTIHQDPAVYPRPEAFEPERWIGVSPSPFTYLPFGGGHRRCIGQAFSDYEQRLVLAEIVGSLDLELEGPDHAVRRNIVMGPKHGVRVRVVARRA